MKKKILIVISAALVFGLAIVAFSYGTSGSTSATAASCCCCSGESCPMKTKDASGKETASCCGADCCKGDGESCPMMKKDASGKETASCCGGDCCKGGAESCPMMKKDASGATADQKHDPASCPMMKKDATASTGMDMKHNMKGMHHAGMQAMHGEGCSCPCCHKENKEKAKDVAGV